VLDVAERLAQKRGFNAFSYADIARELGITKASLHYHFATKEALGLALVERYAREFAEALDAIARRPGGARGHLRRYLDLYRSVLASDRMCLCGMLAAEFETLPIPMQRAVRAFFDANETWLAAELEAGRGAGEIAFAGTPREAARHWTSTLEGALLLARSYGDTSRFTGATKQLLASYVPRPAGRKGG
jgi:TetR/AcrR family transcriptional repressor of nem operon